MTNDSHTNDLRSCTDLINSPSFLLAKSWQLAWNIAVEHFGDLDLTPQQVRLLMCIGHRDGVSQRDLSEAMVVDGATLTGMVTRLEKTELILRQRDPEDRRLVKLFLSPRGHEVMVQIMERKRLVEAIFLERLGEEGVAELCELLRRFLGWDEVTGATLDPHPASEASPADTTPDLATPLATDSR